MSSSDRPPVLTVSRSPAHLLHEILLVDDASTVDYLKQDLDDLVSRTPKLRLLRLESRQGLVRTRMAGIRAAEAEVLTFLDSHIEATDGWLEPLLDRVARNYRSALNLLLHVSHWTYQDRGQSSHRDHRRENFPVQVRDG